MTGEDQDRGDEPIELSCSGREAQVVSQWRSPAAVAGSHLYLPTSRTPPDSRNKGVINGFIRDLRGSLRI